MLLEIDKDRRPEHWSGHLYRGGDEAMYALYELTEEEIKIVEYSK